MFTIFLIYSTYIALFNELYFLLHYIILYYVLHYIILYYITYCIILYYIILYIALYYIYCIILYYIIHCIILYCIISYIAFNWDYFNLTLASDVLAYLFFKLKKTCDLIGNTVIICKYNVIYHNSLLCNITHVHYFSYIFDIYCII